jgi:hypothetical protein
MSKHLRPSPALLVAALAIVVAFAGTALAGGDVHSAKSSHRDKSADKKLFKSLLKAAAPKLSVKFAANAGHANTATTARAATTAGTLAGVTVRQFFLQAPINTIDKPVATIGPVTLTATCNAAGNPDITSKFTENASVLDYVDGANTVNGVKNLGANAPQSMSGGPLNGGGMGHEQVVTYTTKKSIKIDWYVRDDPSLGAGSGCFFSGYVTTN